MNIDKTMEFIGNFIKTNSQPSKKIEEKNLAIEELKTCSEEFYKWLKEENKNSDKAQIIVARLVGRYQGLLASQFHITKDEEESIITEARNLYFRSEQNNKDEKSIMDYAKEFGITDGKDGDGRDKAMDGNC